MVILSIDFETRSTVDLKTAGVYKYAQHPDTDVWCMAWAFGDDEPEMWRPGLPIPQRIVDHIAAGGEVRAWNAAFERTIWREIMVKRYGAPVVRDEQFVCSAAEAAAMALPRALGQAAHVLGVKQEKDEEGYRLMLRMARPRKVNDDGSLVWWDVPDRIERLESYCKQDVRTERAIVKALRRLAPREREVYLLDQRVNDRGIRCDRSLVVAAQDIASIGIARANARLAHITGGDVTEVTNHKRLTAWLVGNGVETESVAKAALAEMLERPNLPAEAREVLELRSDAGRSSIAKLDAMLAAMCDDAQLRGLLLYHAASTGRWAGRLVQPQNFPRGEVSDVEDHIDAVMRRAYDELDLFAHPIIIIMSMLRSMLTAREGNELVAGDFSAIEARVLNWLAGQDDIVALFARGEDVYKHNAAKLYGIPLSEVKKFPHRQTGKFQELACGFGMGAAKAVSAAKAVYQLTITAEQAKEIVDGYRATHPRVKQFWYDAENACMAAVMNPGVKQVFGGKRNLKAIVAGSYLYIILPSGRPLMYAAPNIQPRMTPWGEMKDALHFWGVDPFTKQWGELSAYGGLLVENIVQAVARDLMAEAMLRLEAAGYPPVLSVHDEVVAEVPEGRGDVGEFERLMSEVPTWGEGCPVAAEGWKGFRYRK